MTQAANFFQTTKNSILSSICNPFKNQIFDSNILYAKSSYPSSFFDFFIVLINLD